jgi:hypothetical protein
VNDGLEVIGIRPTTFLTDASVSLLIILEDEQVGILALRADTFD